MANLQRMKFALARGARIECRTKASPEKAHLGHPEEGWFIHPVPHWASGYEYRIHKDDDHLQYGPLSAALREWVISKERFPEDTIVSGAAQFVWGRYFNEALNENGGVCPVIGDDDTFMSMLFVAELLADGGL